jgi:hypothetical protein
MEGIEWQGLFRGLVTLVLSVAGGLALGELILALALPDKLLGSLMPLLRRLGIPSQALFALGVSFGSSRAGAAIVASAYRDGLLSKEKALFGTLLQSFPGYLKRWAVSFPVALGLAGAAGGIYSLTVLFRSFCRFLFFLFRLRGTGDGGQGALGGPVPEAGEPRVSLGRALSKTVPLACLFYTLAYLATPSLQNFFRTKGASFPLLSPAGWTVAAAAFAHANAALGAAGGAQGSGSLTTAQAVLALLVGNMLAVLSRVLRQDLAFWVGIYPGRMVRTLFIWNLMTLVAAMAVTVALAAVPVVLGW